MAKDPMSKDPLVKERWLGDVKETRSRELEKDPVEEYWKKSRSRRTDPPLVRPRVRVILSEA
jgi:hypothetical protein